MQAIPLSRNFYCSLCLCFHSTVNGRFTEAGFGIQEQRVQRLGSRAATTAALCVTRHPPPVEAVLQLGAGIEGTAVQRHDALALELWEGLGTMLQFGRHCAQGVIHPGGHLHNNNNTVVRRRLGMDRGGGEGWG